MTETLTLATISDRLPPIPEGATFSPLKVETVVLPHPFMIGPEHFPGEFEGIYIMPEKAPCAMRGCNLSHTEHESHVTLFVQIEDNSVDLNSVVGLHPWLLAVKELDLGLDGFAFPDRRVQS